MASFRLRIPEFLNFLSCTKYSERVSKEIDHQLKWHEFPAYWVRTALCPTSRIFRRQMHLLDSVMKKQSECPLANTENLYCLNGSRKQRIKDRLKVFKNHSEN
jgi:hypothetical protein